MGNNTKREFLEIRLVERGQILLLCRISVPTVKIISLTDMLMTNTNDNSYQNAITFESSGTLAKPDTTPSTGMSVVSQQTIFSNTVKNEANEATVVGTERGISLNSNFMLASKDIAEFVGRPVLLTTLLPSGGPYQQLTPWLLWLTNAAVARKLTNIVSFRGTMNLRFEVATSPYVFGMSRFFLDPGSFGGGGTGVSYDSFYSCFTSEYSVALDYALNKPAELRIPYFDTVPAMNFQTGSGLGDQIVSYRNVQSPIDVSTGLTMDPSIRVYGYVTEFQQMGSTPQSEYVADRPVSSALTIFSKIMNDASAIPVFAPFATPMSMFAKVGSRVAQMFGYSKPKDVRDLMPMRSRPQNLSLCDGLDQVESVTLYSKMERPLRPANFTGHGMDQLSLAYLTRQWGLLNYVTINNTTVEGAVVYSIYVNPCHSTSAGSAWTMNPLAHTSLAFAKWRGGIEYKISLVSSNFMRGRLRIFWRAVPASVEPSQNVAPNLYLEVTPGAEGVFVVPFSQNVLFNSTLLSVGAAASGGATNGQLVIVLDQAIECPSTASLGIIIQCRAGCDFELANPTLQTIRMAHLTPYNVANLITNYSNSAGATYSAGVAGTVTPSVQQSEFCDDKVIQSASWAVSERIESIRDLMKRYTLRDVRSLNTTVVLPVMWVNRIQRMHRFPTTGVAQPHIPTFTSWFGLLFGLNSGSTRIKILTGFCDYQSASTPFTIVNRSVGNDSTGVTTVPTSTSPVLVGALNSYYNTAKGGTCNEVIATTLAVEIPDTSGDICNQNYLQMTGGIVDTCVDTITPISATAPKCAYSVFGCAGDDFNFHCYFGPPAIYIYNNSQT